MLEIHIADPAWLRVGPSVTETASTAVETGPAVVGQADPPVDVDTGPGLVGSAIGAFLTTLVVGGLMLALVPAYTKRTTEAVLENPLGSFGYGIVALLALVILTILLAITIVGLLVALPLLLIAFVVWAIGAAIGYLAIADRVIGHDDGWTKPLLLGAAINGALALTGIGGLIAFAIGATGFGAILRGWLA